MGGAALLGLYLVDIGALLEFGVDFELRVGLADLIEVPLGWGRR